MTPDFEKLGKFYLGKRFDLARQAKTEELILYDSNDLLTHAVCIGMTGSGKTGLCLDLLEEAIIDGVPIIAIDPKGDIANLLLTFPNLTKEEFLPWINDDEARRNGISIDEFALQEAKKWENGLIEWGQKKERIERLRDAAEFNVYTPGSTAGLPISILKSFAAPGPALHADSSLLRDKINVASTSLLTLLGINADPLKSREHILISNLLSVAWNKQEDLTLINLIQLIQKPSLQQIGAIDLESFFPAKERFDFALTLNNLLAAPGFDLWLQGDDLDIDGFLYTREGKPKVSIFSISHLNDSERMFFVSLLLGHILTWTRMQSGTRSLRAILYMDEIFGYFPPVANPPSKAPLITLLKQARAYGLGILLASQNPVDLDYKGLSNTGTWFIGRLQTERDKMRVLEGLEGAASNSGQKFDRKNIESILSGLSSRVFLMNNAHEQGGPNLFETRWTISYLRGPLASNQIKTLMEPMKAKLSVENEDRSDASIGWQNVSKNGLLNVAPILNPGIKQYFLPAQSCFNVRPLVYKCGILGIASVRFVDGKHEIDVDQQKAFIASIVDEAVPINWSDSIAVKLSIDMLESMPKDNALYVTPPAAINREVSYRNWSKEFAIWLYANQKFYLLKNRDFKLVSSAGETERDFRIRLNLAAKEKRDDLVQKLTDKYTTRFVALKEKILMAEQNAERQTEKIKEHKLDSAINLGATVIGAFIGRKGINSVTVSRATQAAKSITKSSKEQKEITRAQETLEALQNRLQTLEDQFNQEKLTLVQEFQTTAETIQTLTILPKRSNISVKLLTLVWLPHIQDEKGNLLPAWR